MTIIVGTTLVNTTPDPCYQRVNANIVGKLVNKHQGNPHTRKASTHVNKKCQMKPYLVSRPAGFVIKPIQKLSYGLLFVTNLLPLDFQGFSERDLFNPKEPCDGQDMGVRQVVFSQCNYVVYFCNK